MRGSLVQSFATTDEEFQKDLRCKKISPSPDAALVPILFEHRPFLSDNDSLLRLLGDVDRRGDPDQVFALRPP